MKEIFEYVFKSTKPKDSDSYIYLEIMSLCNVHMMSDEKIAFLGLFFRYLHEFGNRSEKSSQKNKFQNCANSLLRYHLGESYYEVYGDQDLTEEVWDMCISKNFQKYDQVEVIASWITAFYKIGFNILEPLFQWVEWTEEYFTKEDITEAIKICEEDPEYKEKGLLREWKYLVSTNILQKMNNEKEIF